MSMTERPKRSRVASLLEVGRAELRGGADAELAPLLGLEPVQVRVGRHRHGDHGRRERGGDRGAPPRLLRRRRGVRRIAAPAGRAVGRRLAGDAQEAPRGAAREGREFCWTAGGGCERGRGCKSHGGGGDWVQGEEEERTSGAAWPLLGEVGKRKRDWVRWGLGNRDGRITGGGSRANT
jgi:hypothetical protein